MTEKEGRRENIQVTELFIHNYVFTRYGPLNLDKKDWILIVLQLTTERRDISE